ncbi:MAG: DUF1801 domain-containing protein [Campylobacterota bacterium]
MQFDLDIRSEQSGLFLHLRDMILSFDTLKEKKNAKQTSYYDQYSAICFLRVRKEKVRLSFANGGRLNKQFKELTGDSKIVRFMEFSSVADVDNKRVKAMIEESLLLNIEKAAIKDLRNSIR